MSYFKGLKLTKLGEQLIAKANANTDEIITIKRAELGAGEISSDDEIKNLTGLKNKWQDVSIADIKVTGENETNVLIELQFNNKNLLEDKIFRELGIYASGKDGTEILFAYSNAGENYDYIPIASNNPQSFIINIFITITSDVEVNANIDLNSYVSVRKLQEELAKKQNINDGNLLTKIKTVVGAINELFKEKQNKEDTSLLTTVKNIVGAINELFSNKLEKGGYTGNAKNLNDEISKKASKTVLGRMIVGDNLTVDDNGRVSGNPSYTHPTGNGNNHIPVNGASGNFLKWLSSGAAQWANIIWSDVTEKPSSFPPSSHHHTKADITDFPTSMKNPNALTISLNSTPQGAYDGSTAKSINITAGGVGAYTKTETDEKFKNFCPFPVNSLYLSLGSENPSSLWLGTTWQKQEGRFLLGSSSSYGLGTTGGASTVKLAVTNLPSHTHSATTAAHTHTQSAHSHTEGVSGRGYTRNGSMPNYDIPEGLSHAWREKAFSTVSISTSKAGGETTGSASPVTSIGSTGSGTAFSIMPPYLTVNIWKRLS